MQLRSYQSLLHLQEASVITVAIVQILVEEPAHITAELTKASLLILIQAALLSRETMALDLAETMALDLAETMALDQHRLGVIL